MIVWSGGPEGGWGLSRGDEWRLAKLNTHLNDVSVVGPMMSGPKSNDEMRAG